MLAMEGWHRYCLMSLTIEVDDAEEEGEPAAVEEGEARAAAPAAML